MATRAGGIGIWDWDIVSDKLVWHSTMYALYGIAEHHFGGAYTAWRQGVHREDQARSDADVQMAVNADKGLETEFRVVWPTGEIRHLRAVAQVQRDSDGKPVRMVGTNWDITALKAHQGELEYLAHFDALTELPNRVRLADRLQHAMRQDKRSAQGLALAYLELDGFKTINDSRGHKTGDRVLATVWEPLHLEGETLPLQVSASMGIAFYVAEAQMQADQLWRQADQAMYQAKLAGKNRFHVFDAAQDSSIRTRHEDVENLRAALERHEFVLYFQPKVNMRTGQVIGAEALIRWQHPQRGLLAPAAFFARDRRPPPGRCRG